MVFASWGRRALFAGVAPAFVLVSSAAAAPIVRTNPNCTGNTAFFNPSHGEDIIVPKGFKVDVFARDLNQPTGLAFVGNRSNFKVLVIESGKGLPGDCNNNDGPGVGGPAGPTSPTPMSRPISASPGQMSAISVPSTSLKEWAATTASPATATRV